MKCKLSQCKCGKTISSHNGILAENICFVCKDKELAEFRRKDSLRNRDKDRKRKPTNQLEKLAVLVEE